LLVLLELALIFLLLLRKGEWNTHLLWVLYELLRALSLVVVSTRISLLLQCLIHHEVVVVFVLWVHIVCERLQVLVIVELLDLVLKNTAILYGTRK
jgi:hypothetical protein